MYTGQHLVRQEMGQQKPYSQPNNNPQGKVQSQAENIPKPLYYPHLQGGSKVDIKPQSTAPVSAYPSGQSSRAKCPFCGQQAEIEVRREISSVQWRWCFLICLGFFPLLWIPFCMDSCDEVNHDCSRCHMTRANHSPTFCPCCH